MKMKITEIFRGKYEDENIGIQKGLIWKNIKSIITILIFWEDK